ncbi:pimeloyl-ACP methyl ester carboxylesterase [Saccharopolyspora erythraea NRRL 2338]|uniref:Alpha/beta hydrolase fold n=2 Tax=Saccharopolyspora erythraea TaxID=1836 RepID=A4FC94_SACEN|nr:alpha/beta fold hydrolase [Saccharopolyspora erythraea]EQD82411.1 alpha/beta hydrolase [Saccharopolyspora erythraea D]PFG95431.1 pimeloyl-ACP methyl ester carboxylesterase [Saccharopolyspora erythraea NRRL 2338]QRK92069.1 alpha/beta hydrolase [Saccharopolyspora erythraea]CAM01669.1 alpha/beta hydrolase fold [Saccharopolyspora erythraea NRRL 2338]
MDSVVRDLNLHGKRVRLREYVPAQRPGGAHDADVVVLIHGIAGSGRTWQPVLEELARTGFPRRVLAPDMPGHGESAAPRAEYGLGAFASTVRDILALEGHSHATLVGHSLGGGVALQFAYQFPEMCGRLVLVDSGGLGSEVALALRATALPGARATLAVAASRPVLAALRGVGRLAAAVGVRASGEARELLRHYASLGDRGRRQAFLATARGVIDLRGQRASALDRLYLAEKMPTLVVWGERDQLIPVGHGHRAAEAIPGSRVEIFESAQHFPHVADPARFVAVLSGFLRETTPARLRTEEVAALLAR